MFSGVSGSGLAFFSRYPIEHAYTHPYILSGRPFDIGVSDWYNGKAAASMVIKHPILEEIEIFNTQVNGYLFSQTLKIYIDFSNIALYRRHAQISQCLGAREAHQNVRDFGSLRNCCQALR